LNKAVSLAQAVEIVEKGAKDLQSSAARPTTTPDSNIIKFYQGSSAKKTEGKDIDKIKHVIIVEEST